ncbi:MAG: hypothetical protein C4320_01360 [Armatimonadota bacterium]
MKIQLKTFVVAVAAMTLVATSFGQAAGPVGSKRGPGGPDSQRGPGQNRRGGMMKMDEDILNTLNLMATQKSQIKTLKEKIAADMKAKFEKSKGDREGMIGAFKEAGKTYKEGLEKILTPDQTAKYKAAMKAKREEMRKKRGGPGGPGAGRPGTPPPSN